MILLLALAQAQAQAAPAQPAIPESQMIRVVGRRGHAPGDPAETLNRKAFRAQQRTDQAFFRPAALGYQRVVPAPIRLLLRNIISNLDEPVIFLNFLLQGKPGKAAETVGRFAINSTLGLGGAVDVAKLPGVRLPHRPNGFADTLGFYGVKPGAYFFLPLFGPTTIRDFIGNQLDGLVLPLAVGKPFDRLYYNIPVGVISGLDLRAESDADFKAILDDSVDPYAALRSAYLQDRAGEIEHLKGRPAASAPAPELGDPLADPAGAEAKPGAAAPELTDPLADPAAPPPSTAPAPLTPPPSEQPTDAAPAQPTPIA